MRFLPLPTSQAVRPARLFVAQRRAFFPVTHSLARSQLQPTSKVAMAKVRFRTASITRRAVDHRLAAAFAFAVLFSVLLLTASDTGRGLLAVLCPVHLSFTHLPWWLTRTLYQKDGKPAYDADELARRWTSMREDAAAAPSKNVTSICNEHSNVVSFNALVKRRMRAERRDEVAALCDKAASRLVALESGAQLVPVTYVGSDCDALPNISSLPRAFALKATHLSGCGLLVRDGVVATSLPGCGWLGRTLPYIVSDVLGVPRAGAPVTHNMLRRSCRRYMSLLHSTEEWGYTRLTPRVIVEELLFLPNTQQLAEDVKCFVFQGRTEYVAHVRRRFGHGKSDTIFTRDGTNANVTLVGSQAELSEVRWEDAAPRPALDDVVRQCDGIARGLEFARVDLLYHQGGLSFGEVTLYPNGGRARWTQPDFDTTLGKLWCPKNKN